ncbi:MAG TPA: hypothetical protein VGL81_09050 [Polyangiaceae bacterium]
MRVFPSAERGKVQVKHFASVAERDAWLTDPALDDPKRATWIKTDTLSEAELRSLVRARASFGMPVADTGRVRRPDEASRQRKALKLLERLRTETESLRKLMADAESFASAHDMRAENGAPVEVLRAWLAACVLPPVLPHVDQRGWLTWFVRWYDERNVDRAAREVALAALRAGYWPKQGAARRGGRDREERLPKASAILKLATTAVRKVRRGY